MKKLKPFIKWAGGKTKLLPILDKHLPKEFNNYFEPMVGGGALMLHLASVSTPHQAFIGDINDELLSCYRCFQSSVYFIQLIDLLKEYEANHSKDFYYKVRDLDKDINYSNNSDPFKAARFIYLNKSCFNGLYRVNSKGYFNVPFNGSKKVKLFDYDNLFNIRKYVKDNVKIISGDYSVVVSFAKPGDLIYFDPPYHMTFNNYTEQKFNESEQIRLKQTIDDLTKKGVYVLLSNSDTEFINNLYKDYKKSVVINCRTINRNGEKRGSVKELLIYNY